MKIPNITGLARVGKTFVQVNRPEILFGASVVATLASVVMAAKGGYEARAIVDAEIARRDAANEQEPALTNKEKFQLTWLCYMPAAATTVTAIGSTTGLHLVHIKEKKQLAAAALSAIEEVKLSAKQYTDDLREAVEENTTEKAQQKINDAIMEKSADRNGGVVAIQNSDGEVDELYLVRDAHSGRDMWSNKRQIEEAIVEVGNIINGQGDCDLNQFYGFAGFSHIKNGDSIGWSGAIPSVRWDSTIRDDGRPVRQFHFLPEPTKGYDRHGV